MTTFQLRTFGKVRRRFIATLALFAVATPLLFSGTAGATPLVPQGTWDTVSGTCSSSGTAPFGAMAWDGSHLWAPISPSVIGEITPPSPAYTCWSSAIDLSAGYQSIEPLYAGRAIVFANGSVWASGLSHDLARGYLIRINPSATGGPAITGEWITPQPADQLIFDGTSLWARSTGGASGALFRISPVANGAPTITQISGFDGLHECTAAFDGTHLWVSYQSPTVLAAYSVNASTTTMPAPVFTSNATTFPIWSMSADSTHLWTLSGGTLDEFNLSDGSPVHLGLNVGASPTMVAADGTYTWVSGGVSIPGTISGVLSSNPTIATTISLVLPPPTGGGGATGVYFDGTNVWAAEASDATIERLLAYPTAPLDAVATVGSNGSASLTWSPPAASGNGPVSSYEFGVSPSSGVSISAPQGQSVVFHGLQPGVTYTLKVRASNGPYTGAWATASVTIPSTSTTDTSGLASTGTNQGVLLLIGAALVSVGVVFASRRKRSTRI